MPGWMQPCSGSERPQAFYGNGYQRFNGACIPIELAIEPSIAQATRDQLQHCARDRVLVAGGKFCFLIG